MQDASLKAATAWLRAENEWLRKELHTLERALHSLTCTAESLHALVYVDALTGLPNRRSLDDRIENILSTRTSRPFALMFIDLDDFKRVNDSLGHPAADALLRTLASMLNELIRCDDVLSPHFRTPGTPDGSVLSRLGGDEFVILLADVVSRAGAESVARRILERLGRPLQAHDHSVLITVSIGIALYPVDGETADVLIQHADSAMYQAKRNGKSRYEFYGVTTPCASPGRRQPPSRDEPTLLRGP